MLCAVRWIVYLAGFFSYFLVVRLMIIVPLFSAQAIGAMHRCFFRLVAAKISGQAFSYDKCLDQTASRWEAYGKAIERFEEKLDDFAQRVLGNCR